MNDHSTSSALTISRHQHSLGTYFKSLNEEWLTRFFVIEPIDQQVLSHPEKIIQEGGQILYAKLGQQVVGCVALKHHGKGVFELTKMAVTAQCQAKGIGAELMTQCIQEFGELGGKQLYLESHSSLAPAIKLYERFGFVRKAHPFESEYQRSDYYMLYQPQESFADS